VSSMAHIADNLRKILALTAAAQNKSPFKQNVQVIAVSKTFPAAAVQSAYQAGQILFGENKVQEGEKKKLELPGLPVQWHLIGHLQTNKARKAAEVFDMIHSIDSFRLAEKVNQACKDLSKNMPVLIQINTSLEDSKSGLEPDLEKIEAEIEKIKTLSNLTVKGFMTIGPLTEDCEKIRAAFVQLRTIRDKMRERFQDLELSELSMGMSSDFELAIQEGATYVRVGSAIFGRRDYQL